MGLNKKNCKPFLLGLYESESNTQCNKEGNSDSGTRSKKYSKRALANIFGISESTLYYKSVLDESDKEVKIKIEDIYKKDDTLGSRKLAIMTNNSRDKIRRIMLKYEIYPRLVTPKTKYRTGKEKSTVNNKLLAIENIEDYEILFSDIFEFRLDTGQKVYCCFVLRSKTREVLSFSYSTRMESDLVIGCVKDINHIPLLRTKGTVRASKGSGGGRSSGSNVLELPIIFHSDQGSQYGSDLTVKQLTEQQFDRSMSRAGTPTDNPYAERFVGIFKHSVVHRYKYDTLEEFKEFATNWIDFYNNERPHEGIGQVPPSVYAKTIGFEGVKKVSMRLL